MKYSKFLMYHDTEDSMVADCLKKHDDVLHSHTAYRRKDLNNSIQIELEAEDSQTIKAIERELWDLYRSSRVSGE